MITWQVIFDGAAINEKILIVDDELYSNMTLRLVLLLLNQSAISPILL
jgi:hypothetical protein